MQDRKSQILDKLEKYRNYVPYHGSDPEESGRRAAIYRISQEWLDNNFYHLFDHWAMRIIAHHLPKYNHVTIGRVWFYHDQLPPHEPFHEFVCHSLMNLDRQLSQGDLIFLDDVVSGVEDDDPSHQFYLARPDLADRYHQKIERFKENELDSKRYLLPKLFVLPNFLMCYQHDPELIEIQAMAY